METEKKKTFNLEPALPQTLFITLNKSLNFFSAPFFDLWNEFLDRKLANAHFLFLNTVYYYLIKKKKRILIS